MSQPSKWPLPPESSRFVVPRKIIDQLRHHPISQDLYPMGFGYYKSAKNHTMLRRTHDDYLLIYCLDGAGKLTVEKSEYHIQAGDLVLLPRGKSHAYHAEHSHPWTIYWIHFAGPRADDFIDYIANSAGPGDNTPSYVTPLGMHSRLVGEFEALLGSRQTSYDLNGFIHASSLLRQLLTLIAEIRPLARQQEAANSLDLERIHSLMQARVHEQLDLDTLAATANLSKFHFVTKYKELTGTTPINHFIHLKIEKACYLLDATNNAIGEVSFAVGYDDAYYFSRIFKKVMGISPTQYRRMRTGAVSYKVE